MKKRKTTIILVLFFLIGILILLYPAISDFVNQKSQSKAITDYESVLQGLEQDDYTEMFSKAQEYNDSLKRLDMPLLTYDTLSNYEEILNVNSDGMIGYITIDKIKVELPIYHKTTLEVLSVGVGHIEGSSLPIGGIGTHSVLSAHRGLPSSKLFTDLDKLEVGDTFTITILDRLLTYEVDKITIVKPNEVESLAIEEDADYVTLMTCTPYGINTHRLLVRGKRVENLREKKYITTEAFKIDNLIVTPLFSIPIIVMLLFMIVLKPVNKKIGIEKYIYPSKYKGGSK